MSAAVRVVLDTNVLVSIFVFGDSRLAPLWGEVESKRWVVLTNGPCLAEFKRVLGYPLFGLAMDRQEAAYMAYRARAETIEAVPQNAVALPRCRDRDDQKFLELARDGGAHWLITADKLLLELRRGRRLGGLFQILTPNEALQKIGAGETAPVAP
ncbi:MAG: putative toxin-antitoxin system toxin component, PIN family [Rhodocyclaceae bacterium]